MQEVFVEWLKNRWAEDRNSVLEYFNLENYGIADVLSFSWDETIPNFYVDIWELKNRRFEVKDLFQGIRYAQGLNHIYQNFFNEIIQHEPIIRINIVCTDFEKNLDSIFLPNIIPNVKFYESSISLNGVDFNQISGYEIGAQQVSGEIPPVFFENFENFIIDKNRFAQRFENNKNIETNKC